MELSGFQQKSRDAIVEHFFDKNKGNRVLCADEPGLGKTYIAKGVIEKLADKKLEDQLTKDEQSGYKELDKFIGYLVKNIVNNYKNANAKGGSGQKEALEESLSKFFKSIDYNSFRNTISVTKDYIGPNYKPQQSDRIKFKKQLNMLIEVYYKYRASKKELLEFIKRVFKNIDTIINQRNTTGIQSGWKVTLPSLRYYKPYTVLYICCNLAIAQQNSGKLSDVVQLHKDCDRLSLVEKYKKECPTPYTDIYPITATIISTNTKGSNEERQQIIKYVWENKGRDIKTIMENDSEERKKYVEEYRPILEEISMETLLEDLDLIIMDEFQNFGQVIRIMNGEDIKNSKGTETAANGDAKEELKYKRLEEICKRINEAKPDINTLILSATPFHSEDISKGASLEKTTQLTYKNMIEFLSPSRGYEDIFLDSVSLYRKAVQKYLNKEITKCVVIKAKECVEQVMMNSGIYRNERYQLTSSIVDMFEYHYEKCNIGDVLIAASAFGNLSRKEYGNNNTKFVKPLLLSTPCLLSFYQECKKEYIFTSPEGEIDIIDVQRKALYWDPKEKVNHGKYNKFEEIILEDKDINDLSKLLWIPPINPYYKLEGYFKKFEGYSKVLTYSKYKVTPVALTKIFNDRCKAEKSPCDKFDIELDEDWGKELAGLFDPKQQLNKSLCSIKNDISSRLSKKYPALNEDELEEYTYAAIASPLVCFYRIFNGIDYKMIKDIRNEFIKMVKNISGTIFTKNTKLKEVLEYYANGCLGAVLEEYYYVCSTRGQVDQIYKDMINAFSYIKDTESGEITKCVTIEDLNSPEGEPSFRNNFNSPFRPFVAVTTSIGAEGLDFHSYCNKLIHYEYPSNPVELEQKNGRIDRRDSYAVRKNWIKNNPLSDWTQFASVNGTQGGSGFSPHWDAGEKGLKIYFLHYPESVSEEKKEISNLMQWVERYRRSLGIGFGEGNLSKDEIKSICINLSPWDHCKSFKYI